MPNFRTHFIAGIIIGAISFLIFRRWELLLLAAAYSILPDIDLGTSTAYKMLTVCVCGYAIYQILMPTLEMTIFGYTMYQRYIAVIPLLGLIALQFFDHREWFHSVSAGLLLSIPPALFLGIIAYPVAAASYFSHLFLDKELFDGIFT